MDKKLNELDKSIKKFLKNSQGMKQIKTQCLSEETIACYVNNLLNESEKQEAVRHLAWCESCLDQTMLYNKIIKDKELKKAPVRLIKKAINLVERRKLFDIIIEFVQDGLKIIEKSLAISILPGELAQMPVRGEKQKPYKDSINFSKKIDNILLEIEAEKSRKNFMNVNIKPLDMTGKIASGLRLNLFCNERELSSQIVEKEGVAFDNLVKGNYTVTVTKKGEKIGELSLELQ